MALGRQVQEILDQAKGYADQVKWFWEVPQSEALKLPGVRPHARRVSPFSTVNASPKAIYLRNSLPLVIRAAVQNRAIFAVDTCGLRCYKPLKEEALWW
jgi:hypothetical protein